MVLFLEQTSNKIKSKEDLELTLKKSCFSKDETKKNDSIKRKRLVSLRLLKVPFLIGKITPIKLKRVVE